MILILTVALQAPTLSQASNRCEVPFEISRVFGLILVRAEINGKQAVLVLDTGSSSTIVNSELVDIRPGTPETAGSTRSGSGWHGTGTFATATLKVGSLTRRDHQILVMDLRDFSKSFGQKIDGMLGMDFMNEFGLVLVDSKHHKLIFWP